MRTQCCNKPWTQNTLLHLCVHTSICEVALAARPAHVAYSACCLTTCSPAVAARPATPQHLPWRTCWYCLNSCRTRQPLSYASVCLSFWNSVLMRGMPRSQLSSRSSSVSRRFCASAS